MFINITRNIQQHPKILMLSQTNKDTSITKWYHESVETCQSISTHADIPLNQIVGFHAPFLDMSNVTYLCDWAYTFDNYEPSYVYKTGQGPQKSYPCFWEMAMYYLHNDIPNKQMYHPMDYG